LLQVIWEYRKPYVIYSHDHRDIYGETARLSFAWRWFKHSFLNVFISPAHYANFKKCLGSAAEPHFILPPPIDTEFFYPREEVTRKPKTVVNLTGRLVSSKGLMNVYKWAAANPDYKVNVYTKYAEGTSGKVLETKNNITIHKPVPYALLPYIYSEHEYVLHLPEDWEAAGRTLVEGLLCGWTLVEGLLCGCIPICNSKVGVASFAPDLLSYGRENLAVILEEGQYIFWYNIYRYFQLLEER